jgi:diacylglycerol kinase family enzyme
MEVWRDRPTPIQVDGELVEAGVNVRVGVLPQKLRVLVPQPADGQAPSV